jgi:hypothetical protein
MFLNFLAGFFNIFTSAMGGAATGSGGDKNRRSKQRDYQTFDHISPLDF